MVCIWKSNSIAAETKDIILGGLGLELGASFVLLYRCSEGAAEVLVSNTRILWEQMFPALFNCSYLQAHVVSSMW